MKDLIIIAFTLVSSFCFAQEIIPPLPGMPFDQDSKLIVYSKVIELPGLMASDLLSLGKKYFIDNFGGKEKDIDLEDKENYYIMFIGNSSNSTSFLDVSSSMFFDFEIRAKEGKLKLTATPRKWIANTNPPSQEPIPFLLPTDGLFKKARTKVRLEWYKAIDNMFKNKIDNCDAYFQKEAIKLKKSKDF